MGEEKLLGKTVGRNPTDADTLTELLWRSGALTSQHELAIFVGQIWSNVGDFVSFNLL